jgi:hypothetical protein
VFFFICEVGNTSWYFSCVSRVNCELFLSKTFPFRIAPTQKH